MAGMRDFLPTHAWAALFGLAAVAMLAFFIPPSVGAAVGVEGVGFVIVIGLVELGCALAMAAIFVYYRAEGDWGEDDGEWRFEP
jgi:hypothetical protein